jgi:predicted ribosomally synthesized peptide with SipW-like signal peptide
MKGRAAGSSRHRHLLRRRPRRALPSARIRAALGLGVVLAIGATGTFAHWTDATTVSGTTFGAASIDLKANNLDTVSGYAALSLSTMVPGNSVAGVLTIKNSGTTPLKYSALSTATNADTKNLRGSLIVKVTGAATVTGASPSMTCSGTALTGSQTTLNGPLMSTGRVLAAGASESVCIQVQLDPAASTSLQGASTNVVFTFNATSDLLS